VSTFLISSGARGGRVAAVHADGSRGPELELGTMVTLLAVGGGELAAWEPQRHRLTVRALDGGEPRMTVVDPNGLFDGRALAVGPGWIAVGTARGELHVISRDGGRRTVALPSGITSLAWDGSTLWIGTETAAYEDGALFSYDGETATPIPGTPGGRIAARAGRVAIAAKDHVAVWREGALRRVDLEPALDVAFVEDEEIAVVSRRSLTRVTLDGAVVWRQLDELGAGSRVGGERVVADAARVAVARCGPSAKAPAALFDAATGEQITLLDGLRGVAIASAPSIATETEPQVASDDAPPLDSPPEAPATTPPAELDALVEAALRAADDPRNDRDERGSWARQQKITRDVERTPGAADALCVAVAGGAAEKGTRKRTARMTWLFVVLHNTSHQATDPIAFRFGALAPKLPGARHLSYQVFERDFVEVGREVAIEGLSARAAGVRTDAAAFLGRVGATDALPALEARLKKEKATKPRDAIERAIARLSVTAPVVAPGDQTARGGRTMRRALWRALTSRRVRGRIEPRTTAEIAEALELPGGTVEAELRALAEDLRYRAAATCKQLDVPASYRLYERPFGWEPTLEGDRHLLASLPEAAALERAVAAGDVDRAEALLETIGRRPATEERPPRLSWRGERPLSDAAQASYEGLLATADGAFLVDPLLTEASRLALGKWALERGLQFPSGCAALVDEVGARWRRGALSKPWEMAGLTGTLVSPRWYFLFGRLDDLGALEAVWPTDDDATGTRAEWAQRIAWVLERSMILQRSWPFAELKRHYLDHPLAGPIARRVVFRVGPRFVVFDESGPRIDGSEARLTEDTRVSVAHPADGLDGWPDIADEAFRQRDRRIFDSAALPEAVERLPFSKWHRLRRELGWTTHSSVSWGNREASSPGEAQGRSWRTEIVHTGYGDGWGGEVPIGLESARVKCFGPNVTARWDARSGETSGWDLLPPAVRSEALHELLSLYSLAPPFASVRLPAARKKRRSSERVATSGPPAASQREPASLPKKGDRVRAGDLEGEVFWVGRSKFGPGTRVGLRDDAGATHWLSADDLDT